MDTQQVEFHDLAQLISIFGPCDAHIKRIEQALGVVINARDSIVEIRGDAQAISVAGKVLETLKMMYSHGEPINDWVVDKALELVQTGDAEAAFEAMSSVIAITYRGKPVKCRTIGQKNYLKAMQENTITICIGPAGTGKTYLAIAVAVSALKKKEISRIILTRPAVEAGEKLGFLPGDLQSKVDPYLRPLYDALQDFLGLEQFQRSLEHGVIEVAPLAYMRGRTLNDAIVIVDESQNATIEQMKMVLTRLGEGAKIIVTGDVTQTDLPSDKTSGLKKVSEILKGIDGIAVITLSNRDVVRHKLVKDIIKAFEKAEEKTPPTRKKKTPH